MVARRAFCFTQPHAVGKLSLCLNPQLMYTSARVREFEHMVSQQDYGQ